MFYTLLGKNDLILVSISIQGFDKSFISCCQKSTCIFVTREQNIPTNIFKHQKHFLLCFWVNLCKAVAVLQMYSVSRGNQKTSPVLKLFQLIHQHRSRRHLFVYSFYSNWCQTLLNKTDLNRSSLYAEQRRYKISFIQRYWLAFINP